MWSSVGCGPQKISVPGDDVVLAEGVRFVERGVVIVRGGFEEVEEAGGVGGRCGGHGKDRGGGVGVVELLDCVGRGGVERG